MEDDPSTYYAQVYFDSRLRTMGTLNRPTFQMNIPNINNFDRYRIDKVSLSNTIYHINESNSFLEIMEDGVEDKTILVSLPSGNYSSTNFCEVLTSELNTKSTSLGNSNTYSCSIDSTNGKLTITGLNNWKILDQGDLYSFSLEEAFDLEYTTSNIVDLEPYQTIYLCSSLRYSMNHPNNLVAGVNSSYVVGSINFTSNAFTWHVEKFPEEWYIGSGYFGRDVEFWLIDHNGKEIDLNGGSFCVSCSFMIEQFC